MARQLPLYISELVSLNSPACRPWACTLCNNSSVSAAIARYLYQQVLSGTLLLGEEGGNSDRIFILTC